MAEGGDGDADEEVVCAKGGGDGDGVDFVGLVELWDVLAESVYVDSEARKRCVSYFYNLCGAHFLWNTG